MFPHFYFELDELINLLLKSSHSEFGIAIKNAKLQGATGSEVLMALRWNLVRCLEECDLDKFTEEKIKNLVNQINAVMN